MLLIYTVRTLHKLYMYIVSGTKKWCLFLNILYIIKNIEDFNWQELADELSWVTGTSSSLHFYISSDLKLSPPFKDFEFMTISLTMLMMII